MSGQGIPQGFPQISQPFVDANQRITRAWLALLQSLWKASKFSTVTVAQLSSPSTVGRGFVSDSTVQGTGNFGEIVHGGGGYTVPVWADPSVNAWRIG